MNERDLRDTVTLVTGAGSGLGEATARAFAAEGSKVAVLDRDEAGARRVCEEITAAGGEAMVHTVDVSDADSVNTAVEHIVGTWGRLDTAVNNAGTDYVLPVHEMSVEQWNRVIGVNLTGPFLVARAALPHMQRQRSGHIVNVASTAALRAWGSASAYHASKWGLRGFGRALGVEGREYGIRVTTVIPGGMKTHFFDRFPEQGIPMPDETHLQDPANVARTIVFAVRLPDESALQELLLTPMTETSWP